MVKFGKSIIIGISLIALLSLVTFPGVVNEVFAGGPPITRTPLPSGPGQIGDFFCYFALPTIPVHNTVNLRDQFGVMNQQTIGNSIEFCASADKNGQMGPYGKGQHYLGYDMGEMSVPEQIVGVTFKQFPQITIPQIRINTLAELFVPTNKTISDPPSTSLSQTDIHYKCYFVEDNLNVALPTFTLEDQFNSREFSGTHEVFTLCAPTQKEHNLFNPSIFAPGAFNNPEHLLCFIIPDDPLFDRTFNIQNQFTLETVGEGFSQRQESLTLVREDKFCLEVDKFLLSVVGGEFIPIDTTSLIVAGAQTNAAWMIPVIVSAAGIGLVVQLQKTKLKHNSCPSCKLESDDIFKLGDKTVGKCDNPKCRVSLFYKK